MADLLNKITQGDCLEVMRDIPTGSVNLIVIDPPYNIGKDKRWDKWRTVDEYVAFMSEVFKECERVLKDNGSFYWWHNDMSQIRKLMDELDSNTSLIFKQFITWDKYNGSKWNQLNAIVHAETNRNYPKQAEYCLFYTFQDDTGLSKVMLDVNNFSTLRNYFRDLQQALGLTKKAIIEAVGQRADHCFRWNSTQWDLPTAETYDVISILQRNKSFEWREYEDLRSEYEALRQEYESMRYTFNNNGLPSVWIHEPIPQNGHITPKPVPLIENIIKTSSNPGDVVLDCFLGSGTTAVACINTKRNFIGIEREPEYVAIARRRIDEIREAV